MRMQSTGQGAMHSPHPEHSAGTTACMRLAAPRIASTGQASMQSVQPMHRDSSMVATECADQIPQSAASGFGGRPAMAASIAIVASPPGGQRLTSASPRAIACA